MFCISKHKDKLDLFLCTDKTFIHCPSRDNALTLLKFLSDNGRTWSDKRPYTTCDNYDMFREDTCYGVNTGAFGSIIGLANHKHYSIFEFDEFDWSDYEEDPEPDEIQKFLLEFNMKE